MSTPVHDPLWERIREETVRHASDEPMLASFLHATILNHARLEGALSFHLANQLDSPTASSLLLRDVMLEAFERSRPYARPCGPICRRCWTGTPPATNCTSPFFTSRVSTPSRPSGWPTGCGRQGRESLALFFQNRMSTAFGVDIHPAARMGKGIMLDHATGLVIGETAVVGNNVSILQSVTLGGTGKDEGDRHPKIGDGVLISAGAKILGNIRVGEGAKVGAGSVVLEDVPAHTTVAGVPAKVVGRPASDQPALEMDHDFCCDEAAAKKKAG